MIHALNLMALRFAWLPILTLSYVVAVLIAWAFDNSPPVVYKGNPVVTALDRNVVLLQFDVERRRFCDATWQRWVSDSAGFKWYLDDRTATAEMIRQLEKESPGRVRVVLPLPEGMRRGHMTYNLNMTYECHPFGLFPHKPFYSVPFYIEPRNGNVQ